MLLLLLLFWPGVLPLQLNSRNWSRTCCASFIHRRDRTGGNRSPPPLGLGVGLGDGLAGLPLPLFLPFPRFALRMFRSFGCCASRSRTNWLYSLPPPAPPRDLFLRRALIGDIVTEYDEDPCELSSTAGPSACMESICCSNDCFTNKCIRVISQKKCQKNITLKWIIDNHHQYQCQ